MVMKPSERFIGRAKAIIDDVLENIERPAGARFEAPGRFPAVEEKVLPPDIVKRLFDGAKHLPQDVFSLATVTAGSLEKGSMHPHVFAILPLGETVEAFFLDPEHEVGEQHWIRPNVVNCVALALHENRPSEAGILRYRAERIQKLVEQFYPNSPGGVDNIPLQLAFARECIERKGLRKEFEETNDIVFRLIMRDDSIAFQRTGADKKEFRALCEGTPLPRSLQYKLHAHRAVLERMATLLEKGAFVPKPQIPV